MDLRSCKSERTRHGGRLGTTVAKLFGDIAVDLGFCTKEQVDEAVDIQRKARGKAAPRPLGAILHELGYLDLVHINKINERVEAAKRRRSIEGFDIISKLGAGANCTVYLAKQLSLDKRVALKVLPRRISSSEDALKRFKREALSAARLNHPAIVQAYDLGESNGFHYLVMEYIQGETLKDLLEREKRLPEPRVIDIALAITGALAHAAEHRIVHRDVKPANVMVTRQGEVKLCDMGLAISKRRGEGAITQQGVIMGTPYYLSPEQARNEEIDERSDLYSLGATLYHLVTGEVPFEGDSPAAIIARHWTDPAPDPRDLAPETSMSLAATILRLLAKEREERYQSAEELIADLTALKERGELAVGSQTRKRLEERGRRRELDPDATMDDARTASRRKLDAAPLADAPAPGAPPAGPARRGLGWWGASALMLLGVALGFAAGVIAAPHIPWPPR